MMNVFCSTLALVAVLTALSAQGQLTPPAGAPAETTKVEARTAIETIPYTISSSGSYYLTQNVSYGSTDANGITITADNVTLDLNGFTVTGPGSGTKDGIYADGKKNITVRNGVVQSWATGVSVGSGAMINCVVEDLRAYNNSISGISVGNNYDEGHLITRCVADNNQTGINATGAEISHSSASNNSSDGISTFYSLLVNCQAVNNSDTGFNLVNSTAIQCHSDRNSYHGFELQDRVARENTATGNGDGQSVTNGSGFLTINGYNTLVANTTLSNDIGVKTGAAGSSYLSQNLLSGNTTNEDLNATATEGSGDLANVTF